MSTVPDEVVQLYKSKFKGLPLFKKSFRFSKSSEPVEILFRWIDSDLHRRCQEMIYNGRLNKKFVEHDVAEMVFDRCVLWPEVKPEQKILWPAGFLQDVVKVIQEKSGFLETDIEGNILAPDFHTSVVAAADDWGDLDETEQKKLIDAVGGKHDIRRIRFDKWVFYIRPMLVMDQQQVQTREDRDIALLDRVLLWPSEVQWDMLPAGVISRLSDMVQHFSGWEAEAEIEEL